ncbi:MAG: hypothetical protein HY669_02595 [Chloroflexi bacterium]|nr:hypothetical protein [Chloroflexota bacterium]
MNDSLRNEGIAFTLPGCDYGSRRIALGEGRAMQQVNPYVLYQLAVALKPIADLKGGVTYRDAQMPMLIGKIWLRYFLGRTFAPLPITAPVAQQLLQNIEDLFPGQTVPPGQEDQPIPTLFSVQNSLREFETLLNNELQRADIYAISQKGIYSTPDLIEKAIIHFPQDVRRNLSAQIVSDINAAGRCLAFDLPTASGFHIMRATEGVIIKYYTYFVKKKPKGRNWGTYVRELKDTDADQKVVAVIDQIRELHRNPTVHPEVVLSEDAATGLFAIAHSAIVAMENDLAKDKARQPGAPPASQAGTSSNAPST